MPDEIQETAFRVSLRTMAIVGVFVVGTAGAGVAGYVRMQNEIENLRKDVSRLEEQQKHCVDLDLFRSELAHERETLAENRVRLERVIDTVRKFQ